MHRRRMLTEGDRWLRVGIAGTLVILFAAASAFARSARQGRDEEALVAPFIEREEVRFVTLDVIVERKEKRRWTPVRDLSADRVTVLLDGEPVELDLFERWCPAGGERAPGAETVRNARSSGAGGPAGERFALGPIAAERAREGIDAPVRYVLYFDFTHLKLGGQRLARKAALRWTAESIRPFDEVMIVTGGWDLRIVRPLRPADAGLREDLVAALDDYRVSDSWAQWEDLPLTGRIAEIEEVTDLLGPEAGRHLADSYAEIDYRRTRTSLRNLRRLMTMFDSIEGTKNLVLFQETMRLRPGAQYPLVSRVTDVEDEVEVLARAANERNVRVYPVAAAGLGDGGRVGGAMTMLGTQTGGRWIENTNDLGTAFHRVAEDCSCFYRVGFRTRSRLQGTTETVALEIAGPGRYRTRHRRTVHDATREERNIDRIQAAMLDPGSARELPVWASATPLLYHGAGARVRVQIGLPLDELLALRSGESDGRASNAWLSIGGSVIPAASRQEEGLGGAWSGVDRRRESFHFSQSATLRIPDSAQGSRRPVLLTRELDVPPGRYRILAVVQDQLVGSVGAAVASLEVPELPAAMSGIQLAVRSGSAFPPDVEGDRTDRAKNGRKAGRVRTAEPALPANLIARTEAVLTQGESAELVFGLCAPAGESTATGGGALGSWRLHRTLSCEGGRTPAALSARRVPAPGLEDRCVVVVEPLRAGSLSPGRCRFDVELEAPGGRSESRSLRFRVTAQDPPPDA